MTGFWGGLAEGIPQGLKPPFLLVKGLAYLEATTTADPYGMTSKKGNSKGNSNGNSRFPSGMTS